MILGSSIRIPPPITCNFLSLLNLYLRTVLACNNNNNDNNINNGDDDNYKVRYS